MNKSLFTAIYLVTILSAGLSIHQAFAQRSPSVEPMAEVSIEEDRPRPAEGPARGFDFNHTNSTSTQSKRVPATITSPKSSPKSSASYLGPLIFLLALPLALWIVIAKKLKSEVSIENKGYYHKTYQFKNYKNAVNESEYDDEDQDFPKAS